MVNESWQTFLIMVLMLKLIWDWHKEWKRKYKAKVERLKRVNRNYARQIENEYNK